METVFIVNDLKVSRQERAFGLACVVPWLSRLPLYRMDMGGSVYNGSVCGQHLFAIKEYRVHTDTARSGDPTSMTWYSRQASATSYDRHGQAMSGAARSTAMVA